ncbi:MAG: xanthine dehydrogenase family protein molybdopterin-binding subunit [Candidatus Eremiobacteraeota bacterium]|nr:xanthine dehydrogenase family protein molybdopterin-binding subunit [Candidatus Eremiobacteraeota bacterium]
MSQLIGSRQPRADATEKVRGTALYTADVCLENSLHALVLRSPHPMAKIRSIDIGKAAALPGVAAIVYSGNVPDKFLDFGIKDQQLFPTTYVRYSGEPVAAIAAETQAQAHAAADAIQVVYEPLQPVLNVDEALADNAPLVHPDWKMYKKSESRVLRGNLCGHNHIRQGDVDAALARSDVVIESSFEFSPGIPGYIEPRAAVARREPNGGLTVWCGSQNPYGNREELADFFDLPVENVRFINQYVGGAFGGKILMAAEWYAAALALRCDRPVRLVWSRHEDGLNVFPRHGGKAVFRSGAAADGTLLAMRASFVFDTGAYIGYGAGTALIATMIAAAPYRIPNTDLQARLVYTNKQVAGSVRAPGGPQATFAKEMHIDEIAHALGMDPLELRLKNIWRDGDSSPTGQLLSAVSARETLERAARAIGWGKPLEKNQGRGLSCSWWFSSCGRSEAKVSVQRDGSVDVESGNPEVGTGSAAGGLPILVAQVLGVKLSDIRLTLADTATNTYDGGVGGSASTFSAGQAVEAAALDVRRQLLEQAEHALEARSEDIELRDGRAVVSGAPDHSVTLGELAAAAGGSIAGSGQAREISDPEFDAELVQSHDFPSWMAPSFTTTAAEVEVDPETGRVRVTKLATAQDVGFAINPTGVIGQIEGGAVQGLGYALSEELEFDRGGIVNTGFGDYLLPTAVDAPPIESIVVESLSQEGPHGIKGVGEPPVTTPAGAIGNAIRAAVGAAPHTVPMTPERVWRALREVSVH